MKITELGQIYLEIQALGILFFLAYALLDRYFHCEQRVRSANRFLKFLLVAWCFALGAPFFLAIGMDFIPSLYLHDFVWQEVQKLPLASGWSESVFVASRKTTPQPIIPESSNIDFSFLLGFGILLWGLYHAVRLWRQANLLNHWLGEQIEWKRVGKVRVLFSDEEISPFSYRSWSSAYILFPQSMLQDSKELKLAFRHEASHLRSYHHFWSKVFWAPRLMAPWNPVWKWWQSILSDWQEFACDEEVCRRPLISRRNYGECLLRVSARANGMEPQGEMPASELSLAFFRKSTLRQRLERLTMKTSTNNQLLYFMMILGFVFSLGTMAALRVSASAPPQLGEQELAELIRKSELPFDVPVEGNTILLDQVNRYLASSGHRRFLRDSIARLRGDQALVEELLRNENISEDFAAISLIESGHRNLPPEANTVSGAAGHWQFIESTARKFGLRVILDSRPRIDDRQNLRKATTAAAQYLNRINLIYNSWAHSIVSYNIGENRLARIVMRHGERDPWKLLNQGQLPNHYLAKIVAGMLFWKNPELLN